MKKIDGEIFKMDIEDCFKELDARIMRIMSRVAMFNSSMEARSGGYSLAIYGIDESLASVELIMNGATLKTITSLSILDSVSYYTTEMMFGLFQYGFEKERSNVMFDVAKHVAYRVLLMLESTKSHLLDNHSIFYHVYENKLDDGSKEYLLNVFEDDKENKEAELITTLTIDKDYDKLVLVLINELCYYMNERYNARPMMIVDRGECPF